MYLFDFIQKLQKLNPKLYANTEQRTYIMRGVWITGLYLKQPKRKKVSTGSRLAVLSEKQRQYMEAMEKGELDKFVGGVGLVYVPEYDIFDIEQYKLMLPGWRTILLNLAKQKVIDLDKAKRVFKRSSLGQSDWDNMDFHKKIEWARGERE